MYKNTQNWYLSLRVKIWIIWTTWKYGH